MDLEPLFWHASRPHHHEHQRLTRLFSRQSPSGDCLFFVVGQNGDNDELTKTNNVGKYNYKATLNSESDVLRNYNVHDDGTNYVNITPYTITDQEVVNLDGSPLYTTKYGQKDAFGTATFTGANGDGTYELTITDSSALKVTGEGKVTQDVGKNIYDTTVELSEAMNGNYQFAGGVTSKTCENKASVTPAELWIEKKGF
ncbi:hypothetical protein [Mitsuokella jalaludinii]|uniref:hypothetical protein n=1 Tax=Mitsuokella jalaludinii TaxID=187979 RepID=UPI003078557A